MNNAIFEKKYKAIQEKMYRVEYKELKHSLIDFSNYLETELEKNPFMERS